MNEYTAERLHEWGVALNKEGNGLGMRLTDYANAWQEERDCLMNGNAALREALRGEASKVTQLRVEVENLRHDVERYVRSAADEATAIAQKTGQYDGEKGQ